MDNSDNFDLTPANMNGVFSSSRIVTIKDVADWICTSDYTAPFYEYVLEDVLKMDVKVDFDEKDVNDRYMPFIARFYDKNGDSCTVLFVLDSYTKKFYRFSNTSNDIPKKNAWYKYENSGHWRGQYCVLNTFVQEAKKQKSLSDIIRLAIDYTETKRMFDDEEFKNFLIDMYRRELVERSLY